MTGGALPIFDRPMKKLLPLNIFFDIAKWWSAQIVFVVTVETSGHFIKRQESSVGRVMGRVAGTAATFLAQWFVRHFHTCQFLAYFVMAADAEVRYFLLEDFADR